MSSITVGAFEAKTHFSQLLKEVEKGNIVHVTRRGKPIALISPEGFGREEAGQNAMERIASRRKVVGMRKKITTNDILEFRDEGRK
ncbi:MAG: type II toxin-antitoxin system prevent-host-death family antitoxin [Spirochaetales bacterium]|nr:type II toxin-antitoxin system prevent-host-death family antitoxin [Spirochaetales bacterium]